MKKLNALAQSMTSKINNLKKVSFCLFACFIAVAQIQAQVEIEKQEVHFEKGKSNVTIESSIKGDQIIDYVFPVKEGQILFTSLATDNSANYFNIMEPKEEYVAIFNSSMNENMYEGELKKTGDYTIRVYLMRSAARRNEKANFRLEIIVSNPAE